MAKQWGFVMAMHKTSSILKYLFIPIIVILFLIVVIPLFHTSSDSTKAKTTRPEAVIKNSASNDSAAESLDTLTADLSQTKQKISDVSKNNEYLRQQNAELLNKVNANSTASNSQLSSEVEQLKNEFKQVIQKGRTDYAVDSAASGQVITIVNDLSLPSNEDGKKILKLLETKPGHLDDLSNMSDHHREEPKAIPYYTIPANATSVRDKLMTALVGRIPIKGVVTDPYPFKLVISDDNLAANGLRIPHLLQMIVSGYCEGDLAIMAVRGWVTSLTFVFDDGTISSTSSNDNDIGNFTKANSLGYLSDKFGNPFIPAYKFITNAPSYLAGNIAIGMSTGAANAYAQSQTTTSSSPIGGSSTTSVTGSQAKFVAGQGLSNGASEVQQWWKDRQEQSFDAVYVPPIDAKGNYVEIAVNFAKEIHIDYNPKGRKLSYAHKHNAHVNHYLD